MCLLVIWYCTLDLQGCYGFENNIFVHNCSRKKNSKTMSCPFFSTGCFTLNYIATFTIVVCVIKSNIPLGWLRWRGTRVCPGSAGTRGSAWSPWTPWQRAGSGQVVTLPFIYNVSPDLSNRRFLCKEDTFFY